MCESVRQKLGHTNVLELCDYTVDKFLTSKQEF
jgi:hypothetical protein